jgi:hypothetical protein
LNIVQNKLQFCAIKRQQYVATMSGRNAGGKYAAPAVSGQPGSSPRQAAVRRTVPPPSPQQEPAPTGGTALIPGAVSAASAAATAATAATSAACAAAAVNRHEAVETKVGVKDLAAMVAVSRRDSKNFRKSGEAQEFAPKGFRKNLVRSINADISQSIS